MKKAIIFDLDGTLWDVLESTHKSLQEVTPKYNVEEVTIEQVIKAFGTNKEETAKIYFPNLPIEEGMKLVDENTLNNINLLNESGGILYPNVKETLKILNQYFSLYIVSNCGLDEYITSFLKPNELTEYFEDTIAASKLGIPKYEAILKIINDHNVDKAIYVGDTLKDQEASNKANIPFIFASYGFGEAINPKYTINNFKELLNLIKESDNYDR